MQISNNFFYCSPSSWFDFVSLCLIGMLVACFVVVGFVVYERYF